MISNKVVIEVSVAGRIVQFYCDPSMPLHDVRQAAGLIDQYAMNRINEEAMKAESQQEPEVS